MCDCGDIHADCGDFLDTLRIVSMYQRVWKVTLSGKSLLQTGINTQSKMLPCGASYLIARVVNG